jgi:hypothetical protein
MSAFGKSFETAFISGADTGSKAAMESIKEASSVEKDKRKSELEEMKLRIKQEQAKADEKYKATSLRNANMAMATQFGDEDFMKKVMTISEELGDSLEGQKILGEFTKKSLEDKMKAVSAGTKSILGVEHPEDGASIVRDLVTQEIITDPSKIPSNAEVRTIPQPKSKSEMSQSRQLVKEKKTYDLISTFETNQVKKDQVDQIEASLDKLPKGFGGKIAINYMKNLSPDDPLLSAWQNMKNWLADEQLMYVAKTKGAISDREMDFFKEAVGNDDLTSIPRLKPIIDKFRKAIEADERAKVNAYKRVYGEDPLTWDELQGFSIKDRESGSNQNIESTEKKSFKSLWS